MNDKPDEYEKQEHSLKTTCPFCLSGTDVHFDVKGRPYWRCWRCEVRSFGTKTAYVRLTTDGWIWRGARPVAAVRAWIDRIAQAAGLSAGPREP